MQVPLRSESRPAGDWVAPAAAVAPQPAAPSRDARVRAALAMARPVGGRLALVLTVSTVVSLILAGMHNGSFAEHWIYSICVGLCCYGFVEIGRHTVIKRVRQRARERGDRSVFPPFRWLMPLIVLSAVLGYEVGIVFGNALLGNKLPGLGLFATNPRSLAVILIITIAATLVTTFWWFACARMAETEARAESAQRAASETQLKLLEAQLEPHMLFNTLANLRALIAVDPERAQEMLDRLIGFMRTTLVASRADQQTLAEEFARAADYLSLMAIRMGPRLQVQLDLPAELRTHTLPPMLLQPLIENAIKHGLEPKVEGGRIEVIARASETSIVLTVRDTGIGLADDAATAGTRFGLEQVRDRVAKLYGAQAQVSLEAVGDAEGGTRACVVLPRAPLAVPAAPAQPAAARA